MKNRIIRVLLTTMFRVIIGKMTFSHRLSIIFNVADALGIPITLDSSRYFKLDPNTRI